MRNMMRSEGSLKRRAKVSKISGLLVVSALLAGCRGVGPETRILSREFEFQRARNAEATSLGLEDVYRREVKHARLLEKHIEELRSAQGALIEESHQRETNLEALRQERESLDAVSEKAQLEKAALEASLAQSEGEMSALEERRSQATVEVSRLTGEIQGIEKRQSELEELRKQAEGSLNKSKEELDAMSKKILEVLKGEVVPASEQPTKVDEVGGGKESEASGG